MHQIMDAMMVQFHSKPVLQHVIICMPYYKILKQGKRTVSYDPNGVTFNVLDGYTLQVSSLPAGQYVITVEAMNGQCQNTYQVVIGEPACHVSAENISVNNASGYGCAEQAVFRLRLPFLHAPI